MKNKDFGMRIWVLFKKLWMYFQISLGSRGFLKIRSHMGRFFFLLFCPKVSLRRTFQRCAV